MFSITSKFPILLVICFLLVHFSYADDLKVETGKADYFGSTQSHIKDGSGKKVGTVTTKKPDYFGRQDSVIKDSSGKTIGTATTGKPDYFGKVKTTYKDRNGNVIGTSVTDTKGDYFGNNETVFKDKHGNTTGRGKTGKPDYFGKTTTDVKGETPLKDIKSSK